MSTTIITNLKKPVARRSKGKEPLAMKSNDNKDLTVNNQLQKLGTLKGLSISRSAEKESQNLLGKASKSAIVDLSSNLEMRKSKEAMIAELKAARRVKTTKTNSVAVRLENSAPNMISKDSVKLSSVKPLQDNSSTQPDKKKNDDDAMKALLKSSHPKNVTKPAIETPAMRRKLLFEKLAAEKKAEEQLKESTCNNQFKTNPDAVNFQSEVFNRASTQISNNPSEVSTKKLVTDSIGLLNRPVKRESHLVKENKVREPTVFQNEIAKAMSMKNKTATHRVPGMNIKKESIENVVKEPLQTLATSNPNLPKVTSKSPKPNLTTKQVDLLTKQFEIKDYLSRKEMRMMAIKTSITDAQVRDWFKERRIEEDTPMIVDEKNTDVQLSNPPLNINIKKEPIDTAEMPRENKVDDASRVVVKQELLDDDDEPDSAVLDPLTGKLLKKTNIDKKMEEILAKAPLLDALTKKIEMVNNPRSDGKEKVKDQISGIIDLLDDEIEITKENIVNPGKKPLSKVLNTFLAQVEQLEKTMNVTECNKNIEIESIIKEASRKDESINDLTIELTEKRTDVDYLEQELKDKNDELESILLNSVSKETFIRTQFQALTSEVRELKKEKADVKAMTEKVRELEKNFRKKNYVVEDLKEKYESSQNMLRKKDQKFRDLEEMSTKMVGDITRGIGEKLAASKVREQELKACLEKNEALEFDLKQLGITFKQQNEDLIRIKREEKKTNEELSRKNKDLVDNVKVKDEEITALKTQVNNLTKRFREKVKEIQETLSKYNDTLKSKNNEISDKAQEIIELQEHKDTQGHLIKKLKDSIRNQVQVIADLKETEVVLQSGICEQKAKFEEYKIKNKVQVAVKPNLKKRKSVDINKPSVVDAKRVKLVGVNAFASFPLYSKLIHPISGYFLPTFASSISIEVPAEDSSPLLSIEYNWPVVSFQPNSQLLNLKFLLENNCSKLLFRTYENSEPMIEESHDEGSDQPGTKRKNIEVVSSCKRFRISPSNRPISCYEFQNVK